ncbi:MAG: threonine aldolase family protein, partial [Candidatus Odinarchaeota archaeon]
MSKIKVDFRSDTVTKPSPEMWEAIRSLDDSKLGDDVLKEDPTVNELEEKAARITNKEAALLVTSGTQGNIVSLLSSTNPGDEVLLEDQSHILIYEVGGAARLGGLVTRSFPSNKGVFLPETIQPLIRTRTDVHQPWTTLLCVENTHNRHGGTIFPLENLEKLGMLASEKEFRIHMDGARIFNAAVALKRPVTDFAKHVDSIMFCLSKGLSCPVGSLIVGSQEFIDRARKNRKLLGGGMRQAGIIAITGLIALEQRWIDRLTEDHDNARRLAKGLEEYNLPITIKDPQTNILMVECPIETPMDKLQALLTREGILAYNMENRIRLVTHYGINREDIDYSIEKIAETLKIFFSDR